MSAGKLTNSGSNGMVMVAVLGEKEEDCRLYSGQVFGERKTVDTAMEAGWHEI